MSGFALQAGYLLHYTPWRDTSFIVDLFTLEHGRLGLVARGARSAKPATRALYQPFRPLLVSWTGEGELRTLTGIEDSGAPLALGGAALASAYYLNELVLRLLGKEQPQPALFAHYALAIASLETDGASAAALETILRTFELQLLETTGLLPDLARCAPGGAPVDAARRYRFDPATATAVPIGAAGDGSDGYPDEGAGEGASDGTGVRSGRGTGGAAEDEPVYGIPKRGAGERIDRPATDRTTGDVVREGVPRFGEASIEVRGRTLLDMAELVFDEAVTREEAKRVMRVLIAAQLGGRPLRSRSMFEALVPPPPPPEDAASPTGARPAEGADSPEGPPSKGVPPSEDPAS